MLLSSFLAETDLGGGAFDPRDPPLFVLHQQSHSPCADGLHEESREPFVVVSFDQNRHEFIGGDLLKIVEMDLIDLLEIGGRRVSESTFACAQNLLLQP